MKYVHDYIEHPKSKEIEQRLKVIQFFDEYGSDATRKAFGKSRSTVYLWKSRLNKAGGKLSSLAPGYTRPIHKRKRIVNPFIEKFIIEYRSKYPGVDKTTITPIMANACTKAGIKPVSESTVGRIIHDLKEKGLIHAYGKVTINGLSGKIHFRKPQKRVKQRRKGFSPQFAGDLIQMDTIAIFFDGIRRYIFTAIDVRTRFAFAYAYKTNSSANGQNFLEKFLNVVPFTATRMQTDNGGEFEKHFDKFCNGNSLIHYFNYPKHPQSNGCIERFNRTIQEQFVNWNIDDLCEPDVFNRTLMKYLIWYNTERPHRSLGKLPPLRYYIDTFISPLQSNMLWTLTGNCK